MVTVYYILFLIEIGDCNKLNEEKVTINFSKIPVRCCKSLPPLIYLYNVACLKVDTNSTPNIKKVNKNFNEYEKYFLVNNVEYKSKFGSSYNTSYNSFFYVKFQQIFTQAH